MRSFATTPGSSVHPRTAALLPPAHTHPHPRNSRPFQRPPCHLPRDVPRAAGTNNSTLPTAPALKFELARLLTGVDRGIFGLKSDRRQAIADVLQQLELRTAVPAPLDNPAFVAGQWRLLYTTVTITGVRKTKLGLREFVKLDDVCQTIDVETNKAINEVFFSVAGLGTLKGSLKISAGYTVASPSRVDVAFEEATLQPKQLQALFEKNYDLLLSIFNPEGWLEVTYVDDSLRIGRDNKGHVFVLERM